MSSNILNEDLRSVKTKKSLYAAMFTLLQKHSFRKITIKAICEEALISRAAFYAHFIDKYDLLEQSMTKLLPKIFNGNDSYEKMALTFNRHIYENASMLENLVNDADQETLDILFNHILFIINLSLDKNSGVKPDAKNIVLSNFYAGGMISYLLWHIKNKFPKDVPPMNKYLYEIIHTLKDRQSK